MEEFLVVIKWDIYAPYDYYECKNKKDLDDLIKLREKEGYIFMKIYELTEERE